MKTFLNKIKTFAKTHVKTSIVIALVILFAGYRVYASLTSTTGETTYTLGTVTKNTIVSSITGSGQVSANRSLDLKPKASGNVVYIGVTEGQTVTAGMLIAELDATDAQKSVRDATANLASAELSMKKIQEPADSLTILQAQNALDQAKSDLSKSYDDGYTAVSNTFVDMPGVVNGLDSTLHGTDVNPSTTGQQNVSYYSDTAAQYETAGNAGKAASFKNDAEQKFLAAKTAYDKNFEDYRNVNAGSDTATIQKIIDESYTTARLMSDAIRSAQNLIQYYQDTMTVAGRTPIAKSTVTLTALSGYTSQMNGHVSGLLSAKNTIANDLISVPEKEASLQKVQDGADPLDVESVQLSITKSENSLQDAKDTLENYFVRAPFGGTIAKLDIKKGDPASSGTAVATLIANEQVVDIPLNEVDVSKVKVGDKATLTFDAVDALTLTGKVASVDTVGTVTQGVVNYTVTVSFDATDPRVKPGMSTTASIITEVHQDVLTVPSSAVKSGASGSYVQVFPAGSSSATDTSSKSFVSKTPPEQIPVTVGISDDTNTEILSGVTEGEEIVIKSVTATATTPAASSAPSLLGGGARAGAGGGGGAAFRAAGR